MAPPLTDIEYATSPSPLSPEFKLEVAKKIVQQQHSITAVRRWVAQYKAELNGQPSICLPLNPGQQRIRQLEAELRIAKEGNEVLVASHHDVNQLIR